MICPNKKSPEWQKLVQDFGEDLALVKFNEQAIAANSDPVLEKIAALVGEDPNYYKTKYADFLGTSLDYSSMIDKFRTRFNGLDPKLSGDIVETSQGTMTLFPASNIETLSQRVEFPSIRDEFETVLKRLESRFGFGFTIVNDPKLKFKGKYTGDSQTPVTVNLAYATKDTPFHEYYHPFVHALRIEKPQTFQLLLKSAVKRGETPNNAEEAVTSYLGKLATKNPASLYLGYFLQYVRDLLGLSNNLTAYSTILELSRSNVSVSKEGRKLSEAFQKVDDVYDMLANKFAKQKKEFRDYVGELMGANTKYTTSDTSSFYQDTAGNDIAKRLTAFIGDKVYGEFSRKAQRFSDTPAEGAAKRFFKQRGKNVDKLDVKDITETITYGDQTLTFAEVTKAFEERMNAGRVLGKFIHSYIYYRLETSPTEKEKIKQQGLVYAKELGEPFISFDNHPRLAGLSNNFQSLLDKAGVIIDTTGTQGIPKSKQDKAAPEISLVSDLLVDGEGNKLGTTADGLFQHYNGEVTLLDWKTGNLTSDKSSPYLMDFGDKYGINDSKLSKGYLELAYRAIMLKEKFPEMKFRSIKLVKIDHQGKATPMELDLQPYLYTIADYYKAKHPQVYEQLQAKGLFAASNYKGTAESLVSFEDKMGHLTLKEKHLYLQNQLAMLYAGKTKSEIQNDPHIRPLAKQYSDALLELEKDPATDLASNTEDLSSLWKFKNFSDIANPKVQTLHKIIMDAKRNVQSFLNTTEKEHDALYKAALSPENKSIWKTVVNAGATIANVYGIATFSPLWFVGSIVAHRILSRNVHETTQKHFKFMWRESSDIGRPGHYLNLRDTYLENGVEIPLTNAQKEYRSFVYSTMQKEYNKFASAVVGYKFNDPSVPLLRYEKLGIPPTLPEDFLPRVPKPVAEIREEENFASNVFGLKTVVGANLKRSLTNFLEDNYVTEDSGIPLRYFKHSGSDVVTEANHSWNVETAFKFFMTSLKTKEQLDPVYDVALGVYNGLQEEKNEVGEQRYGKLVQWLDNQITLQVTGKQDSDSLTAKKITLKANKLTEKLTDIPEGTPIVVSQDRLLRFIKSSVTYSVMSFKVWSPVRNALMIAAANSTQATRGWVNSALSYIIGVPPESFETINLDGGRVAVRDYMKAKMFGKEDESKLWNIAKNLDWLPDNYPYAVNNDRLLSQSIKLSATSNAFLFYQIGENLGALWQLAGLMKSIKIKDATGKETTLWDAYDNKGNWTVGERGVTQLADGSFVPLKELTALEIKSLKRAYEKLNGSYRTEEKTAMEVSVLGDFIMQFHKYFYQYLKVLFASPYKDITVGKYVLKGERPDGMPVYQWHSEVMEGQLRVLTSSIFAAMSGKGKQYLTEENLGENTLKGHRARALAGLTNTFLWFLLLSAIFHLSLDDDEEKSYVGRSIERTIMDLTRGANPADLWDTAMKPIVALDKMGKTALAFFDLLTEGVTGETDQQGWPKGLKTVGRAIPGLAGSMQIGDLLSNDSESSEHLFGIFPVRP